LRDEPLSPAKILALAARIRHDAALERIFFQWFRGGDRTAIHDSGAPSLVSTSAAVLKKDVLKTVPQPIAVTPARRLDRSMLAGVVIALGAAIAGIAVTGVKLTYFFQPTGALIVLGGTLGVMFITTPLQALIHSLRRVAGLMWTRELNHEELVDDIIACVRAARTGGWLAVEPMIGRTRSAFLNEALLMAIDIQGRNELHAGLETRVRLRERAGDHDAKTLEVAGGFALANLVLLPAAQRIRARTAAEFEAHELIMEGILCLFDGLHPSMVRDRLNSFLREPELNKVTK
jgi:chemotaxis protein MotA